MTKKEKECVLNYLWKKSKFLIVSINANQCNMQLRKMPATVQSLLF